ncbi:MAG: hypothetical protein IJ003_01550 [Candidatus Gastranaerophilales bacterium]|nr:hypothetical protein [Candidatus Gastranaerophilales bacterium]
MSVNHVSGNYSNYGTSFSAASKNAGGEAQVKDESAKANVAAQNAGTEAAINGTLDALGVYGQAFISKTESFEELYNKAISTLGEDRVADIEAAMVNFEKVAGAVDEELPWLSDGAKQTLTSETFI